MNRYTMRVVFEVLGGHTHITIATGKFGGQTGKCGEIIMTNEEFQAWREGQMVMQWEEKPCKS
jgi:hypothetical protein